MLTLTELRATAETLDVTLPAAEQYASEHAYDLLHAVTDATMRFAMTDLGHPAHARRLEAMLTAEGAIMAYIARLEAAVVKGVR